MHDTALSKNSSFCSRFRFSIASHSFWINLPRNCIFNAWNSAAAAFSSVERLANSFRILVRASSRLPVENSSYYLFFAFKTVYLGTPAMSFSK